MASTNHVASRSGPVTRGPHVAFVASVLLAFLVLAASSAALLPQEQTLPLAVMLLFGLAALVSVFAWRVRQPRTGPQLNYWDVAGALVLIGVGLSVLIEPEQLAGVLEAQNRRP